MQIHMSFIPFRLKYIYFFHRPCVFVLYGLLRSVFWPSSETLVCLMSDRHLAVTFLVSEVFMGPCCRCGIPQLPSLRAIIQSPKRFAMVLHISIVYSLIALSQVTLGFVVYTFAYRWLRQSRWISHRFWSRPVL